MPLKIDLNSDLGEEVHGKLDEQIMPFISSCNIACGGHAGDEHTVERTVLLAKKHGVAIGAHPSYPDKENFGRQVLDIPQDKLRASLLDQMGLIQRLCEKHDLPLNHLKPHGALYHQVASDESLSAILCEVIEEVDPELKLYGMAHCRLESIACQHGITFVSEGFSDRKYHLDGSLMSRKQKGAVLTDQADVLKQVEELTINQRVYATKWIPLKAETICLHSDTEGAVHLAKQIRRHLEGIGVQIISV